MSNSFLRHIEDVEFNSAVHSLFIEELRKRAHVAYNEAIAPGDVPDSIRNQRIGVLQGLQMAFDLAVEVHKAVLNDEIDD